MNTHFDARINAQPQSSLSRFGAWIRDVSAATAILGFAWMIMMWGSVLGIA